MKQRAKTGIPGLDEMLHGGFIPGSAVLVQGAPGTGKTTLGLQFLYHGITQEDEPGLFITFEEFPQTIYRDALSLGWDLQQLEEAKKLRLIFTSPRIFLPSLEIPTSPLNRAIMERGVKRVVLDSITHFTRLTVNPIELRKIYTTVVNGLKREGVTTLLTGEEGTAGFRHTAGGLAFLVDTIILTRYVEIASAMERAIMVIKMRGSSHDKAIRRFEIRRGGIIVGEKFEGQEGLLTGSARRIPVR